MGIMYDLGRGVSQDYAEAAKWYGLAARQGHVDSQYNLGILYGDGQGVPKDQAAAYVWLNLSATQGDLEATKYREIVASGMTGDQLAEAQRLYRECLASNYGNCP